MKPWRTRHRKHRRRASYREWRKGKVREAIRRAIMAHASDYTNPLAESLFLREIKRTREEGFYTSGWGGSFVRGARTEPEREVAE
jgi:hypothetical protein